MESSMVVRAQRAEEQLSRAMERERVLRQELERQAQSDESLHGRLGFNLSTLDQQVAKMKEALQERTRAVSRADRLAAQLEQQNQSLKSQLESANQKLDAAAEAELAYRIKLKEALDSAKRVELDKAALREALGQSMQEERAALIGEHTEREKSLAEQLKQLRQDKALADKELQSAKDTAAFQETNHLQNELSRMTKELEEREAAEALLRREAQLQQTKLKKSSDQVKALESQLQEAQQLWSKSAMELSEAKQRDQASVARCETLQNEVSAISSELNTASTRASEAERTCSSVVDLLLTVKERVTSAAFSAQTMANTMKKYMGDLIEKDAGSAEELGEPPATTDSTGDAVNAQIESMPSRGSHSSATNSQKAALQPSLQRVESVDRVESLERVERAVQALLDSPAAGTLGSISQTVLGAKVKNSMRALEKIFDMQQKGEHQRMYKLLDLNSMLVRSLDQAAYELHSTKPISFETPLIAPGSSAPPVPLIAPTASVASRISAQTEGINAVDEGGRAGDTEALHRTLQQVAQSLAQLAETAQTSNRTSPSTQQMPEVGQRGMVASGRGVTPLPFGEWGIGEEDALSPVLSTMSESMGGGSGQGSGAGSGVCAQGRRPGEEEGIKSVFKRLLMLDGEEGDGAGARRPSEKPGVDGEKHPGADHGKDRAAEMVQVRRAVVDSYVEQLMHLEQGIQKLQTLYIRKDVHEQHMVASQDMWAGRLERLRQASHLHVEGLQHDLEVFRSRGHFLEGENASLKEAFSRSDVLVQNLEFKLLHLTQAAAADHEAVASIDLEAHLRIQKLSEDLSAALEELQRRGDYDMLVEENANLKTVIADTASSVTGAVELRAETLRQLMADNEEAEKRIAALEKIVEGAESRVQAVRDECAQETSAAADLVQALEERCVELEEGLGKSKQNENDAMALIEGMKESIEEERLKAMTAELQNLKEVQVPTQKLQEAQEEVLMLKEEVRLMEEYHQEELGELTKKEQDWLPKIQVLTKQFKVEMERSAKSKLGAQEVAQGLREMKTAVTSVLQDSLMLISQANKCEQALQDEKDEREKDREQTEVAREKERRELAERQAKLAAQSKELDNMAAQYKELLVNTELELSPGKASEASSHASATGDIAISKSRREPSRASGKPPRSPSSPPATHSASPKAAAAAAAAGGVPAKLIDTLMHECIQVKTSPDGLPPEDSSDAEGEEEEIVAAVESSEKTLGAAVALLSAHGGKRTGGREGGGQSHWLGTGGEGTNADASGAIEAGEELSRANLAANLEVGERGVDEGEGT